jgi:hypothetical protein
VWASLLPALAQCSGFHPQVDNKVQVQGLGPLPVIILRVLVSSGGSPHWFEWRPQEQANRITVQNGRLRAQLATLHLD